MKKSKHDDSLELARYIAKIADDKVAHDIVILNVGPLTSYANYLIIISATNDRQVKAIADHIGETVSKERSRKPLGIEGTKACEWVLLDYGDIVIHVFHEQARARYDLEGFWTEAEQIDLGFKASGNSHMA